MIAYNTNISQAHW